MAEDAPIIGKNTSAANEAVETVLGRLENGELFIPPYQRDSDEWDAQKKSLFLESILNRLTVPAFYVATSEGGADEVVDGQQRLMTMQAFFNGSFALLSDDDCPYYGNSVHYAGLRYDDLAAPWQQAFRRYMLSIVSLPDQMPLDLRLEVFRRINQGGTPLSGQDIRLSYYSESSAVRFVQLAGIYNDKRAGAKRMIEHCSPVFDWPWDSHDEEAHLWKQWWNNTKTATGQTSSEMFLWFIVSSYRKQIDRILKNKTHLTEKLKLNFRNRTEEVLDIVCAQLRFEDLESTDMRLLPNTTDLQVELFPKFLAWWSALRRNCVSQVTVSKYRTVALLIPGLVLEFESPEELSDPQWGWIGNFVSGARAAANKLSVDFPESKGRWTGTRGQRNQIDAFFQVANKIKKL